MKSFKINIIKEISIIGSGLSTMCRLCLSSDVTLPDIFCVSSKMENTVADVIMKYTAVQITRDDEMPNFICQSCFSQLKKTHQFLMQIEQSDRTLRSYLQQLKVSNKPANCSVRPFESISTLNCKETESASFVQENKNNEEMCLKSEIKVEPINFLTTECKVDPDDISSNIDCKQFIYEDLKTEIDETKVSEDKAVNWKEKNQQNHIITDKFMEKISLKSEIKFEPMADNSVNLTELVDNTENASSGCVKSEISCEYTKINTGRALKNSCLPSANFSKCEEAHSSKKVHYKCNVCIKFFFTSRELKIHQRMHTVEKPYQCDLCNKGFNRSSSLYRHKRTHTAEKRYQCDLCNKCFTRSSNLNLHKRAHTAEKPYPCDLCNKGFTLSSHLKIHKRIHSGEKPYQCDLCKKCFSQLCSLKTHKRIHTGEKPYQCNICKKCFTQSYNLNIHKFIHTGEKRYQCDLCNKCFRVSSSLNRHKRIHM